MTTPGQHDGSAATALLPSRELTPVHRQKKKKNQPRFLSALAYPKGPTSSSSDKKDFKMKTNPKCFTKQSALSQLRDWGNIPSAAGGAACPAPPPQDPFGSVGCSGVRTERAAQRCTLPEHQTAHHHPSWGKPLSPGVPGAARWQGQKGKSLRAAETHAPTRTQHRAVTSPPPLAPRSPTLPRPEPRSRPTRT